MQSRRPNVLFLMSDEHRADVTGYAGNTVIRTPVLDELSRGSVVFRNANTPSPICIPGCQCLMAVQLLHGVTAPARVDLFAAGIQLRHDAVEVGVHLGDFSGREHTSGLVVAVFLKELLNLLVHGVSLSVFGVSLPDGTTSACCPKGACLVIAFCYKTRPYYTNHL